MVLEYNTEYNIKDVASRINLQKLPMGDLDEKLFFRLWGKHILIRSEEQLIQDNCWTLHEKIYDTPFALSVVNHNFMKQVTAWQDWQMFDYDICGEILGDKVIFSKIQREKINLEDHILTCTNYISQEVKKIENYELPAVLSYSQGIDSLVILSYLHKYNYHKKVKLVHLQNPLGTIHNLDFSLERQLGFEVEIIKFEEDDLYRLINKKDAKILRCYTTSWLLEKYSNYIVIFGHHGNPVFGHYLSFLHETTKQTKLNREKIYSKSLYDYNLNLNDRYALSKHCHNIKPWDHVNSYYNGRLNNILEYPALFDSVRSIDWTQVESGVIIDAEIARRIIHSNVGSLFDNLITDERNNEMEVLKANHELDIDKLDPDILKKLRNSTIQNDQGLAKLNKQLEYALANKKIPLKTVTTVLNIRRLDLSNKFFM